MDKPIYYDISHYRLSYILLKPESEFCKKDDRILRPGVRYDKNRKRHFISGHITTYEHMAFHKVAIRLPKPNHVCILPVGFEKELDKKDLKRFLFIEVPLADIDYIVVSMGSFDPRELKY